MARRTKYIVYVDKDVMDNPDELVDAVLSHFINKDMDIRDRKQFLALFMKAPTKETQSEVIDEWVQVRDVAGFPFRKETEAAVDVVNASRFTAEEVAKSLTSGEEQNADTVVEGGIPVDDGADGKPESGASSE